VTLGEKARRSADGAKGSHRGIDAARNVLLSAFKKLLIGGLI
jgi:hypothetical protein